VLGEESARWFEQEPTHRRAALLFPVLARPGSEELAYFTGRWSRGYLYRDYLLGIVRDIIAPALGGAALTRSSRR
jgi:hypothetical protein